MMRSRSCTSTGCEDFAMSRWYAESVLSSFRQPHVMCRATKSLNTAAAPSYAGEVALLRHPQVLVQVELVHDPSPGNPSSVRIIAPGGSPGKGTLRWTGEPEGARPRPRGSRSHAYAS